MEGVGAARARRRPLPCPPPAATPTPIRDVDCAPGWASSTCNTYGVAGTFGFAKAFVAGLA